MRTYVQKAKEETGKPPACTGALLKIKRVSVGTVKAGASEWSQEHAGCRQYNFMFVIQSPKGAAGMTVFDRITVGTPDDKDAIKESTWDVSEGPCARLRRLLTRSGTALAKDDEEWMADALERTVVAPITVRGEFVNVGLYYRETDKDCPVIGLAGEKGKPAPRKPVVEDDDDDTDEDDDTPEAAAADEDEKPAKSSKKKAKKAPKPADDDEDDDDNDEDDE